MLDILPADVWSQHDYKWLDPFCKSGVFLREVATRLLDGLAIWEPNFERRREHIFRNMLYGASITEMTGIISRRTLYYSRDASSEHSVLRFNSESGHLPFVPATHNFGENDELDSCSHCGAPANLERGESRENYAYAFIHEAYPTKEMGEMNFDVIVGNPPYQIDSDGNTRTRPVYQHFVRKAIDMQPRYVVMITPSRWFAGGLGMRDYRQQMLADKRFKRLVDYRVERDAFPGVNINGGVSYFLWDREHEGQCEITHVAPGGAASAPESRPLDEFDILVRQNEAVGILRKVRAKEEATLESKVSSQKPFEFHTNFHGADTDRGISSPLLIHGGQRKTWISRSDVTTNTDWIDQWKVLLPAASDGNEVFPLPIWDVAVGPFLAGPREVCNGSHIVVSPTKSKREAINTAHYLRTRFVRFLVSLRKIAQHNKSEVFRFVPDLPMDRKWTDADLFERYELTTNEIAFIESQIKELPAERGRQT